MPEPLSTATLTSAGAGSRRTKRSRWRVSSGRHTAPETVNPAITAPAVSPAPRMRYLCRGRAARGRSRPIADALGGRRPRGCWAGSGRFPAQRRSWSISRFCTRYCRRRITRMETAKNPAMAPAPLTTGRRARTDGLTRRRGAQAPAACAASSSCRLLQAQQNQPHHQRVLMHSLTVCQRRSRAAIRIGRRQVQRVAGPRHR